MIVDLTHGNDKNTGYGTVILQDKANKGTNGRRHQLRDTSRCACRHFTTVLFHFSNRPDAQGVAYQGNMSAHEIEGRKNG